MDSVRLDIIILIASAVCLPGFALVAWGSLNRYRQREDLEE